jgi:pimeloyl-ACP methyl ester carboxylesterase
MPSARAWGALPKRRGADTHGRKKWRNNTSAKTSERGGHERNRAEGRMSVADDAVATDASICVNGSKLELIDRGRGRPILFLHPHIGLEPSAPVFAMLAAGGRLIAPSHPGFGRSELPPTLTTVDDLAYFYLDAMDALDLEQTLVVGISFGAWIAAAIAIKSTARMSRLVLANPVGIKVGDRDILDVFAMPEDEFNETAFADPAAARRDHRTTSEEALRVVARNRESAARFAGPPYMHDPKLKDRLHRIAIPTLVLWGALDRLVEESYGRAFCAAVPGAKFERIEGAGHFPHLERPKIFAEHALAFAALNSRS